MSKLPGPLLEVSSAEEWRQWLDERRQDFPTGIWLVYFKPHAKKPCASYNESVEEALCYGWVDSLVRRLDEDRYARKFTPRKKASNWSESNRKRVRKLVENKRMTPAGMALVEAAKKSGTWKDHEPPKVSEAIPGELQAILEREPEAVGFFDSLTDRQRAAFAIWINSAVKPDTRRKRIETSLDMIRHKRKMGMK